MSKLIARSQLLISISLALLVVACGGGGSEGTAEAAPDSATEGHTTSGGLTPGGLLPGGTTSGSSTSGSSTSGSSTSGSSSSGSSTSGSSTSGSSSSGSSTSGSSSSSSSASQDLTSGSTANWFSPCFDGKVYRFRSSFDGNTKIVPDDSGKLAVLKVSDSTSACGTTTGTPTADFRMGQAVIQYEAGTDSERHAQVALAPDNSLNNVLDFWLNRPHIAGTKGFPVKGRIQMVMSGNKGIRQARVAVRLYLHPGFNAVRSYPDVFDWLTISEWWNNPNWGAEKFPFRIAINVVKESADPDAPLRLSVHAQTFDTSVQVWEVPIWSEVNREFSLPVGKWISLDYWFVEGANDKGRFVLGAKVDGQQRTVIFDIRNTTHHPDDPSPDGLSEFNPIKLYTSANLIDHVRSQGESLEMSWDDFELVTCKTTETNSPGACELLGGPAN